MDATSLYSAIAKGLWLVFLNLFKPPNIYYVIFFVIILALPNIWVFITRFQKRRESKGWQDDTQIIAKLRGLTPTEFEEYVARIFEALGYKTELTGGAGDEGIDIKMTKDGRRYLVQCKQYFGKKITPHHVRDFYGAIGSSHIDGRGYFVTTSFFTSEAERWAEDKNLELVDVNELIKLMRESGLVSEALALADPASGGNVERCPLCKGVLIVRTNNENKTRFLGCSNYPKCRFTKAL